MQPTLRLRSLATALALAVLTSTSHAAPGPGDVPPPDVGHTSAGDEVLLTNYSGKVVVMSFWASWCPQCIKELPILEALQDQVGKDHIAVIAVNTESPDVFRRVTRLMRDKLHLELVSDANGAAQHAYGVNGIPHLVIIGRDGRILRVHRGYSEDGLDDILADINRALAPAP